MDDSLRDTGWALLGLALFSALAGARVQSAARRDVRRAVPGGTLSVKVITQTPWDAAVGQVYRARISGSGFSTLGLPFVQQPGGGLLGDLRHLDLDLHDIVLSDLPVHSLRAEIPNVRVDGPYALFGGHLRIRGAGEGTVVAVLQEAGLAEYLSKKRPLLHDLKLRLTGGQAHVSAMAAVLVGLAPVEATARVAVAEGRYLNAVDATVLLNGKPLAPAVTDQLLKTLNPIIDVDKDLHLGDWLYVTDAEIGEGTLTVQGKVRIPLVKTGH